MRRTKEPAPFSSGGADLVAGDADLAARPAEFAE
jgi:hypothetical protein